MGFRVCSHGADGGLEVRFAQPKFATTNTIPSVYILSSIMHSVDQHTTSSFALFTRL